MRQIAALLLWTLILATAGLPLAALIGAVLARPSAWALPATDVHHAAVFARTIGLASASAAVATLIAIPPAAVMARGRRWAPLLILPIMAGLLVVPGPAWAYGWAEFLRQSFGDPRPHSWSDLARVVITNATAYWPIPAAAIALAWRRLPSGALDAASLDGARGRIMARLLLGPAAAGWAGAMLLSAQNLSAPDLSGVVVASFVVRETFQFGGGDQAARLAAAVVAGMPSFLLTALVALAGWQVFRRSVDWGRDGDEDRAPSPPGRGWPAGPGEGDGLNQGQPALTRRLRRPPLPGGEGAQIALGAAVLLAAIAPPVVALLRTNNGFDLTAALEAQGPALGHGLALAAGAAGFGAILALLGTLSRPRWLAALSLTAFLLGGQFVALGMIRAYHPPPGAPQLLADLSDALYDTPAYHATASVALFAWLPLAAAGATWTGRWRGLRDMAAADGANALQSAAYVILPLAWPGLLAAALAMFALGLTESQAAALLVPWTPINFMLSNVHTLNYAAMAEAALLMTLVCAGGAGLAVAAWLGSGWVREARSQKPEARRRSGWPLRLLVFSLLASHFSLLSAACDRSASPPPLAIWSGSGAGPGQIAYPRAISYSPADDSVWVVDKTARVQQFDAATGEFRHGWQMPDSQYGKPVGISTDADGNVWVADTHYYRVIVFRPDGTEWFRFGQQGEAPGQFAWPTDVLVLDDGRVLVSEYGSGGGEAPSNDRIQIFQRSADGIITDPAAQCVGQIGRFGTGEGEFRRPQSMAVIGEVLWVTDGTNHRLEAFSLADGRHLRTLGVNAGSAPGEFRFPYGLEVDDEGMLLVSEFGNHRVQKIDPETGAALGSWGGRFGSRAGEVKYPWGLAYDPSRDRVIVLDSGNDRLQVVKF